MQRPHRHLVVHLSPEAADRPRPEADGRDMHVCPAQSPIFHEPKAISHARSSVITLVNDGGGRAWFAYDDAMSRRTTIKGLTTAGLFALCVAGPVSQSQEEVSIRVNTREVVGKMTPMWAWFGYDEPNYTYMKDGKKLLSELAELSPVPVFVRAHNLLTTGDGTPGLKWGSTNAYTEGPGGRPRYDWTIVDRIFDTYVERKMKPLVEIGFMPQALSTKPEPYRHDWAPGLEYSRIYTGWAYPPSDHDKWRDLVAEWVRHSVER